MTRSTTAREALVAELLGEVAELLDRADALVPAMNDSRQKLSESALQLKACAEPVKAKVVGAIIQAQDAAVEHIRRRTGEIAGESLRTQTQAMNQAARAIIDKEVGPPLQQLASTLRVLVERTRRPQWETWTTYAATAVVSAILATCLSVYLMHG